MLNAKRGMLIAACAGTLFAAAFGCGPSIPDKIGFAGQNATLQSGTQVNFQDAWVADEHLQGQAVGARTCRRRS